METSLWNFLKQVDLELSLLVNTKEQYFFSASCLKHLQHILVFVFLYRDILTKQILSLKKYLITLYYRVF